MCMQLTTADKARDMIQGGFYEKYNFYADSCAISPSPFLLDSCLILIFMYDAKFNCAISTPVCRPYPVDRTKGSVYFAAAFAALWACGLGRGLIRWPFTNLLGSSVSPSFICCSAALTVSCGVPCSVLRSGTVPMMTSTGTSNDLPGPDGVAIS